MKKTLSVLLMIILSLGIVAGTINVRTTKATIGTIVTIA